MVAVLVVEDDRQLNDITCMYLRDSGYDVTGVTGVREASEAMRGRLFDVVISDIMMPGVDGFRFAEQLRRIDPNLPIIFVTARDDIAAKRHGFRSGVDDYMVKPIDYDELVLRIEALLRRSHIMEDGRLTVGGFTMDADQVSVTLDGREIPLTAREFKILYHLLSYPKQAFTRAQLMEEFWDDYGETSPRAVDVHIANLRKKLGDCPYFDIVTIHGLGYKAVPR
ncbi:response regulator transcription factor [Bifidobacterium phasiani]|uniref:Heme response regulator HssR n=1 Tax=Bifidobacterium phasiani TaxID=2834431 RepID=A0ABS6W7N6_9BIFI|nr:response regulator transcription factor [Bifidobacterium phasiani]MBW3082511.1 response regulator transcription factor [Bifidobacterium phasiani]